MAGDGRWAGAGFADFTMRCAGALSRPDSIPAFRLLVADAVACAAEKTRSSPSIVDSTPGA
eukprot:scaffold6994_cov101-Isochrysis_galbana.AAC.3